MFRQTYKRYVLGALTLVYTLSFLDQGLVMLLVQPIALDLHLSDTQVGFLTGIAFGLLYATLALPVARWADRGNRVTIASIAVAVWGATVMACLVVTNFVQLIFARIAASVGGAGCMPPTYSLVGDYFPEGAERTRAIAVYMLASSVGVLTSFLIGGWLNEVYGWRVAFFVMGIPGLLVAVLVKLTITEPRQPLGPASDAGQLPGMKEVLRRLWAQSSSRHLALGLIVLWLLLGGLGPWYAAFMMRSHGMGTAELGVWFGLIFGVGGTAGTLLGGYAASHAFAHDERAQMRLTALMIASVVPCHVLFLTLPQKYQALIAFIPLIVTLNFFLGPTFALLQRLVVDEMRATTLAVVTLLANIIGLGVAPQIVGVVSDSLRPALGTDSLRYAMLLMSLVALWSAWHIWQVGRTVREDLSRVGDGARDFNPRSVEHVAVAYLLPQYSTIPD